MKGENMQDLIAICAAVTAFYQARNGIALQCAQATKRLQREAKKAGYALDRAVGFFGGRVHWWCVDRATGTIYDPTAEQFTFGYNGEITSDHPAYRRYDEIPSGFVQFMPHSTSLMYEWWLNMKKWKNEPTKTMGENKVEKRVAKNGKRYTYITQEVFFTPAYNTHVRTVLVFPMEWGYHISVTWQTRVPLDDGRIIYPTSIQNYFVKHGVVLRKVRNKCIPSYLPDDIRLPIKESGVKVHINYENS